MNVLGIGATDTGRKRANNEDSVLIDNEAGFFVISDGMGGHAGGEIASTMAVETVRRIVEENTSSLESIRAGKTSFDDAPEIAVRAIKTACREIYRKATNDPNLAGMGCTVTLLLSLGEQAAMAHVGDTRLYVIRDGKTHQLSADHTLSAEFVRRGVMTAEAAKTSDRSHVLTRVVGTQKDVEVDWLLFDVLPGDRFVLCTDGLHGYLSQADELVPYLDDDFEAAPEALVQMANRKGGQDNISVIAIRADPDPDVLHEVDAAGLDVMDRIDALASSFLFTGFSLVRLARVLQICREKVFQADETIVSQGEPCSNLFVVLKGSLQLSKDGRPTRELGFGDTYGENSLFTNASACRSLKATKKTHMLVIEREALQDLLQRRPWLGVEILTRFCEHLGNELDRLQ